MNLLKANILPIGLGALGLILVLIGIFQMISRPSVNESLSFDTNTAESKEESLVVVDVEGAIVNPGVYKIPSNSRLVDALAAAGGLSEDADRDYVQKNINLAKKVADGLKIYVPRTGEEVLSQTASDSNGPVMNINSASQSELEALPGIGAVTAQKIIEGRPYSNISDLINKKVVGQAVFEKIKDKIAAN